MGVRRKARETALQLLYQLDEGAPGLAADEAIRRYFGSFVEEAPVADTAEGRAFAEGLVRGAWERRAEIDAVLQRASHNWRLDRMARVDRNLLRLATYELLYSPEVPTKAVLNEAIEIAKRFGTAESPAFINGVLDRVVQEARR